MLLEVVLHPMPDQDRHRMCDEAALSFVECPYLMAHSVACCRWLTACLPLPGIFHHQSWPSVPAPYYCGTARFHIKMAFCFLKQIHSHGKSWWLLPRTLP